MKKRLTALMLCVCLLIGVMQGAVSALDGKIEKMPNGESIYFTVTNDVLHELKYATMPFVRDGVYYIPYTLLTNNFNIRSSYSSQEKILYLSNMRDNIKFDINAGCAYDETGKIDQTAILTKGQVFIPLQFTCEYLGISYSIISKGPIIRLRDENSYYPNQFLSVLFENRMREMLDEFLGSLNTPTIEPPPEDEEPVTVYLTFDDGPSDYTSQIVDALAGAGCRATFFLLGSEIVEHESSVRKIYITGNEIGLHSFSHDKKAFYASSDSMLAEFADTNLLIRKVLQTETRLVRIPFGSGESEFTPAYREALKNAGYRFWDWTIHANDLDEDATAESVLANIVTQLETSERETEVILMHENAVTVEMLPALLKYLTDNDFIVELISPLDDPINVRNET